MNSNKPIVWLIGGSSPLAQALSKKLGVHHSIISFGRSSSCDIYVDLTSVEESKSVFRECMHKVGIPKAIFFCQRFRPSESDVSLAPPALLSKATMVEVYPMLTINSILLSLGRRDLNVRMIVFSSTLVFHGENHLIPHYYRATKSMVTSLIPNLTTEVLHLGCTWNCILLSHFFKGNGAHTLERLKQLAAVSKKHVQGKIPRIEDIASFASFMISSTAIYMNGESIIFDGSYAKFGQGN